MLSAERSQLVSVAICYMSALTSSFAAASMKKMNRFVHYIFLPYYLSVVCLLISAGFYVYDRSYITILDYGLWDWLLLSG